MYTRHNIRIAHLCHLAVSLQLENPLLAPFLMGLGLMCAVLTGMTGANGVPPVLVFPKTGKELALFGILISSLMIWVEGIECTLSIFGTKLGGNVGQPEGRKALWKDVGWINGLRLVV